MSEIQKLKDLLSSEFDMKDLAKALNTLAAVTDHLSAFAPQSEAEKLYMSNVPYASAEHWQAVKRIFRYLRGTSDVGLIYGSNNQCLVTGYSDSDYAVDIDGRRSMTGYVYTLVDSVVSWKATLQSTVTLSTTEAEYMTLTEAAKEGIWLKGLISDLGIHHDQNQSEEDQHTS
ncbi:secreted RxLR effector protein 161-like [Impatiens glandulifera]|uniref:secreted RxLR effector protein 161-like n=1 Tax=Impatiens glandulifera TaxID=253017 RepID=UPI001FB19CD2|nr:secreted RxLR effector protein 161-like [Impatiens glandulifera]